MLFSLFLTFPGSSAQGMVFIKRLVARTGIFGFMGKASWMTSENSNRQKSKKHGEQSMLATKQAWNMDACKANPTLSSRVLPWGIGTPHATTYLCCMLLERTARHGWHNCNEMEAGREEETQVSRASRGWSLGNDSISSDSKICEFSKNWLSWSFPRKKRTLLDDLPFSPNPQPHLHNANLFWLPSRHLWKRKSQPWRLQSCMRRQHTSKKKSASRNIRPGVFKSQELGDVHVHGTGQQVFKKANKGQPASVT